MRDVTKDNITDVFMSYMGSDMNPRLREVMGSLVRHLHDFAREVNLTHDEWNKGIAFLEAAGEISDKERHEFVLLSDVLGLSSLVDMLHNRPEGTSSSVLGPFHITGSPDLAIGADMKRDFEGPVVLVEALQQRTHAIVPQLDNAIVQRRKHPRPAGVEGKAFHPIRLGLKFG